ncbi:MAG TPA: nuclear transport factor 2 family protein [Amycolatopsis sp.]|nr:nuclear transport factor 2 family protein [Amycolatopsis sp.]
MTAQAPVASSSWLHDVEQLRQLKARYGDLVDRCMNGDRDTAVRLSMLFTEDCVLDFTQIFGRVFRGRADIVDFFGTTLPGLRAWTWHSFTNPIVEIDGDRAEVQWYLYAMSTPRSSPRDTPNTVYGRYHDHYVRSGTGWLQSGLTFLNETRTAAPRDQGEMDG